MNYLILSFEALKTVHRKATFLLIPVIFCVAVLSSEQSISAQTSVAPSASELDQFRTELGQMIKDLNRSAAEIKQNAIFRKELAKQNGDSASTNSDVVLEAQEILQNMSYEDIAKLHRAFRIHFPNWREAAPALSRFSAKLKASTKNSGGTNDAITPDDCNIVFNSQPSWTDWSIAKSSELGAQAIYEGIPEPINLIALAAWTPIAIGASYAEFENALFERCSGDQADDALQTSISNVSSTINNFNQQIQENDDDNTSLILNNLSSTVNSAKTEIINNNTTNTTNITNSVTNAKTEIVSNDNTNRTQIINNNNSNATTLNTSITTAKTEIINNAGANKNEVSDLLLRGFIEADLARGGDDDDDDDDGAGAVAWFLTPTAKGGKLDLVQQIVTLTLSNIQSAGASISNAQFYLNKANQEKAAGRFKSAYSYYRKAYQTAAK